jgi:exosome complex RNA-binding protein Rrp42 (RNase PH superfamily)
MLQVLKEIDALKFEKSFLDVGLRSDGRSGPLRPMEVSTGVIGSAVGSASCKLANSTRVIAGVTAGIFSFPQDTTLVSKQGRINVSCDMSLKYPGERRSAVTEGGAMSCKLEGILRNMVDVSKQLLVWRDETNDNGPVWDLTVNIVVLNDDGGLLDCALMAAVAALKDTLLPKLHPDFRIDDSLPPNKLDVGNVFPVGFTFCRFDNQWLIDPSADEEKLFPRLQVVMKGDSLAGMFGLEGGFEGSEIGFDMSDVLDNVIPIIQKHAPSRTNLIS